MSHRLSQIFVAVSAASLLLVSTAGIAAHQTHKVSQENYKAETNYKAEVPPPCPPILMLHDGFYLGVGVGYDSYRIHETLDTSETEISTGVLEATSSASRTHAATGWMGGIFAGYGRYFDTFYIGLEINANTSNADATSSFATSDEFGDNDSGNSKVEARSSYGIALLPGIKVNDSSLLYARLGYLRTNFKGSANFNNVDAIDATTSNYSVSTSRWRNGFQFGIGIETAVAEDISIRGEFTHTSYNTKTASATFVDPITGTDNVSLSDRFNLSNNEFMFSVLYHFC